MWAYEWTGGYPPALAPHPKMLTVYIQISQTTVHTTQCIVYSCCYPSANYYLLTSSTVQSTVGCNKMFDGNFLQQLGHCNSTGSHSSLISQPFKQLTLLLYNCFVVRAFYLLVYLMCYIFGWYICGVRYLLVYLRC